MRVLEELQDERTTKVAGNMFHGVPDEDGPPPDLSDVQLLAGKMGITFQADLVDPGTDLSEALVD